MASTTILSDYCTTSSIMEKVFPTRVNTFLAAGHWHLCPEHWHSSKASFSVELPFVSGFIIKVETKK